MATRPVLPLIASKDIEALKSWEGIETPADLVSLMARKLSVDPNQLEQFTEVLFSDVQPPSNSSQLWIKTDPPVGIGIPSGGSYVVLYQYPPNVPFIHVDRNNRPPYLRKLTASELENYNLTAPDAEVDADWVIMSV